MVTFHLEPDQIRQAQDLGRTIVGIAGVQDSIAVVVAVLDHVLQHTSTRDADIDAIKEHLDTLKTRAAMLTVH